MTSTERGPLTRAELLAIDAYWRAANYLTAGQIYLMANPLLTERLRPEHIKPRLLGHWGTSPGLNFIWAHLSRAITVHTCEMMIVIGPGHGGPAALANTWLEGSYSEVYPGVPLSAAGMHTLFRQFSFPGGVPSHVAPETPGSIHEGGELGYSLAHACGAAFDNPGLVVACVVGDGEAETGPLATGWHGCRFLDPARDGAVLPILHLNGYKIANPALLARIPDDELDALLRGYGYAPSYVTGHEPFVMHEKMAAALDGALAAIRGITESARSGDAGAGAANGRPRWPLIVLRTPKGWTGPAEVDGLPVEGTWRSHQVPLPEVRTNPAHLRQLQEWLLSYRPEELFDPDGRPREELLGFVPRGDRRLGASPHANGGALLRDLALPDFRDYAVPVPAPGAGTSEPTRVLGGFLRDVMRRNIPTANFRVFGPDETESNRLNALYEVTGKTWEERIVDGDNHLAADGRVMEILSEHTCQGWLEGYLLTGRHGFFSCYEAFIHIVDSMFNQHAKWLKVSRQLPWRRPVASLNYLLTSHVWRQDHNGFSHQDPGFVDLVANKGSLVRVYLAPDANTLLSVADREQRVGVRREVDPDHLRLLVHNVVDEAGILVREAVVILPPDVGAEQVVEGGDRTPPGDVLGHLEPLRVLVEHRIDDMDERLVAVEEPVAAREEVPLEPALAEVLGEDLHHPPVGREMVVERIRFCDPGAIRGREDVTKSVGSGLVRPEEAEVLSVAGDDIAKEAAEHTCGLAERGRRLVDLDRVVAKVGQNEIVQQHPTVRMRIGTHPAIACWSERRELG